MQDNYFTIGGLCLYFFIGQIDTGGEPWLSVVKELGSTGILAWVVIFMFRKFQTSIDELTKAIRRLRATVKKAHNLTDDEEDF